MKLLLLMRFGESFQKYALFLAEFRRLGLEKAVFATLEKFRFCNNFCFRSPNQLLSIVDCLELSALSVFAFNSNMPFLVIFVI